MHILIVEDNEDVGETMRGALEKAWGPNNVKVDCCFNIYQAQRALEDSTYDLITMDLDLSGEIAGPDRDVGDYEGLQLLASLPQSRKNSTAGVLIVSGHAERPAISSILKVLRRKDVLEKPHTDLDFIAKARSILETRDAFIIQPEERRLGVDTYGTLSLDRKSGVYKWRNVEFSLTTSQYRIMDTLASRFPNAVPPAEFIKMRISKTRESLSVQISQIRDQMRSIGAPGDVIRFDPKGYMLDLPLD